MQLKAVRVVRIASVGQSAPETTVACVCASDVSWLRVLIMCVTLHVCVVCGLTAWCGCGCGCASC